MQIDVKKHNSIGLLFLSSNSTDVFDMVSYYIHSGIPGDSDEERVEIDLPQGENHRYQKLFSQYHYYGISPAFAISNKTQNVVGNVTRNVMNSPRG